MLSDKPKLVFSDIGGRVTLEARLPCLDSIVKQSESTIRVFCENRIEQIKQAEKPAPEQQYLKALYIVREALL